MKRLSRWSHPAIPLLAVIVALGAVVDVATKAVHEQLERIRGSKLGGFARFVLADQTGAVGEAVGYKTLLQRRADLLRESKPLADKVSLEPEEATKFDDMVAELGQVNARIAGFEKLFDAERAAAGQGVGRAEVVRDLAGDKPWASFGQFLMAVHAAGTGRGVDARLVAAAQGMNEAVGADGGYAVPVEYAGNIEKMMWDTGQVLSRVSDRPVSGNAVTFNTINETSRADGSRRGGIAGYWVDEAEAPTASRPKLAKIEMKLRKVAALGYMTDELIEDAPALQAELTEGFAEELVFKVEDAIFRGDGASKPLGFLGAPCLVTVSKETGQAADTILTTNLSKMWARLPARSQANAVWFVNVDCQPQLDELTIPAGTAAVEPRFINYGPDGILRIKGRPVIAVEYAASIGDLGDITLVDLSQYRLIRKAGVEQAESIHVAFSTFERAFRASYRVDGQPMPRAAITPFKGSNTLSPFIALQAR